MTFYLVGLRGISVIKQVMHDAQDAAHAKRLFTSMYKPDAIVFCEEATVPMLVRHIHWLEAEMNRAVFDAISETVTKLTPSHRVTKPGRRSTATRLETAES